MEQQKLLYLKGYMLAGLVGLVVGFLHVLTTTFLPEVLSNSEIPTKVIFGSGPIASAENLLLSRAMDLLWLKFFFSRGIYYIYAHVFAAFLIVYSYKRFRPSKLMKLENTIHFYIPYIGISIALGVILDLYWMGFSLKSLYFHFSSFEIFFTDICCGILVANISRQIMPPWKVRNTDMRVSEINMLFVNILFLTAFAVLGDFAWPCRWFLITFVSLQWFDFMTQPIVMVLILFLIYSTILMQFAVVIAQYFRWR